MIDSPSDVMERVRKTLAGHRPSTVVDAKASQAAVALIIAGEPEPSILLIRRQERAGDPWSGHMALPGGYRSTSDANLAVTAARETREETSLDLAKLGKPLGTLSDVRPRNEALPPVLVRPFVFEVERVEASLAGPEVVETLWIRVADLFDPRNNVPLTLSFPSGPRTFPSIQIGRYTIWGLTERILAEFAAVTGF